MVQTTFKRRIRKFGGYRENMFGQESSSKQKNHFPVVVLHSSLTEFSTVKIQGHTNIAQSLDVRLCF